MALNRSKRVRLSIVSHVSSSQDVCQYSLMTTANCGYLKTYLYWNYKSNYKSGTRGTAQPVSDGSTVRGSLTDGDFCLLWHTQTDYRPIKPLLRRLPGFLSRGSNGRGVNLTTHIHLVLRLRISGAEFLLAILRGQRQLYTPVVMIQR